MAQPAGTVGFSKIKRVVIFSDSSRLSGFDLGEVRRPLRVKHT